MRRRHQNYRTAMNHAAMPRRPVTQRGFTLIEMMITVVIIVILAAVSMPQYTAYVTRGRVPDATSALATKQVLIEQFFQDNRTYVGAPGCASDASTSKYFTFACSAATTSTFTLTATGKGAMSGFSYSVNQAGAKSSSGPTGWTGSSSCWITKKDGSC